MGYPVHNFLEEFGAEDVPADDVVHRFRPRSAPEKAEHVSAERVKEAYSRGYEDGHAAAEAHMRAELDAQRAKYDERMEHLNALFSEKLSEQLTSELRHQIANVHVTISDQLVAALLPVMRHVLTEASVRELIDKLGRFLNETGALAVELRGPADLIERVSNRLVDMEKQGMLREVPSIKCIVDETAELRVTANDTVIESRVMDWIDRIKAAVE
jgi:hypothetical protein